MGKKMVHKQKTTGTGPSKSGKSIQKVTPLITKKKRKFKPIANKTENSNEKLKKLVTNVQRSKGVVSSNWKAFLSSGLAPKPKSPTKVSVSNDRAETSSKKNIKSRLLSKEEIEPISNTPTLNTDDPYICELEPKSEKDKNELTRCIAMDCEMVGVYDGRESVLARVSLVNQHGECVYDKFVKTKEEVADYRTKYSGVRPDDLKHGESFEVVQKAVADMINGRILVGHALHNDLKVLHLSHPPQMIRDTSRFKPFRKIVNGRIPSLKKLTAEILGVTIQSGEHSSAEDAKAAMQLYNLYQKEWENYKTEKKLRRRRNAVAAALGLPKEEKDKPVKHTKDKNPANNQLKSLLLDEFAAF